MKHFLVDFRYLVPVEQLAEFVQDHRSFLQTGYDKGWFLMSGPKEPRVGGYLVCRAPSLEALQTFLMDDPYRKNKVAEHIYTEFHPVKFQPFLSDWVSEE